MFFPNRTQRLREAAASRSFHLKNTAILRDLAFEPYAFVASAAQAESGASSGGGEEGWDDWGDGETTQGVRSGREYCSLNQQLDRNASELSTFGACLSMLVAVADAFGCGSL